MAAPLKLAYSVEAYLAIERAGPQKHEFYQGEIFALAGGSPTHNLILSNVVTSLNTQLRRRDCVVYPSDMRVKIPATGLYTYPDSSVVCGTPLFDDAERDTLLNPITIIEILSPSTEEYDRGRKFQNYQTIATLREYILIAQDTYHIERYSKQPNGTWSLIVYEGRQTICPLPAIACTLDLDDIYNKVTLELS
jgi:Uma2 family endonuclease